MAFSKAPNIYVSTFDHTENDIVLKGIGYDNMNITKPFNFVRVQDYYTLHVVLSGSGKINMGGKTTRIKAGDIFFVPPNIRFLYYPDKDNKWEYVWFNFVGDSSPEYAKKIGLSIQKPVMPCKNFPKICSLLVEIFAKIERNEKIAYCESLTVFSKIIEVNSITNSKNKTAISERAKDYVNQNYFNADLTVAGICSQFNVSHSYMCRIFKRDNGITLKNYIINKRIHEACRLLRESNLEIKEIVYSVGFLDIVHFMKIFKKYMDMTPKKYRITTSTVTKEDKKTQRKRKNLKQ